MIVTYMWSFIKKSKRNKNRLTETKSKLTIARRVTRWGARESLIVWQLCTTTRGWLLGFVWRAHRETHICQIATRYARHYFYYKPTTLYFLKRVSSACGQTSLGARPADAGCGKDASESWRSGKQRVAWWRGASGTRRRQPCCSAASRLPD